MEGDDNSGDENETDQTTKSIVSTIRKPNEEKYTNSKEVQKENGQVSQTNRKIKDMNRIADHDERSIENRGKGCNDNEDAKSGHRNNIDRNANNHDDNNMSSAEKSKEGNSDTINTRNDARTETEIGNHIIPEVKSDSKDIADIKNISNENPIKKSLESNGHQNSNSKSKRSGESSRTYSPDSNERKKHKSGSYNDDLQNSRGLRNESSEKTKRKNIIDSGRLDEKEKRHKQSKKKRDSSSDSSSNSSSSDDQSDSDKSSTNSSSYSDSSDDSSSDSDAKKKSKKQNSKKLRSKKLAREKEKDKKSSDIHRREGRVSRKKSGRKSSIRNSDSSD